MGSEGWIKLHREIFDSDIWHDVTTFRLFIYLIGKASHQDGFKYKGITLNRGQYVRSYRKLADDLSYKEGRGYKKYSLSTIKSCVNKLIEAERVNVNETELGTLFTVINYDKYQPLDETKKESPNGSNDEVRTNAELTPNEVRTNAEQDQELKNLRIKELKDTTTTTPNPNKDAIVFYQNNIGMIRPSIAEEMLDLINDFGDEMVIEALSRSLDRNKPSWGYAKSILKSWENKGIKTIEQAKAEEVEFQNQQKARFKKINNRPAEVVPDWFRNRDQQHAQTPQSSEQKEEERKKLAEMIKEYS